jgi:hypothetical protein
LLYGYFLINSVLFRGYGIPVEGMYYAAPQVI